jgi:glycosyltransferase involved in cell wall biosynthesis
VRYAIVANGFADGPAQALRDYVVASGAHTLAVAHPLTREDGRQHTITEYADGRVVAERRVTVPLRAPLSYAADPFIPLQPPRVDAWFGFNPLACAAGLVARRTGRASFVALWSVDFVPDRFGRRNPVTWVYDRIDRLCCLRADARIELSVAALEARRKRHGLPPDAAPAYVVPMGAWLARVPVATAASFHRRRVAFLGHLVERQGVDTLLEALAVLRARGETIAADIIGTGPLEASLRDRAHELGLGAAVTFHGFVPEHREVERILSEASLAVAPYRASADSFTRYADPGKLKIYLAAALPILLTDVPPNAAELAREAGAQLVPDDATALADAIAAGLASPDDWQRRSAAARGYAGRFDWAVLLPDLLTKLGLDPTRPAAREGSP